MRQFFCDCESHLKVFFPFSFALFSHSSHPLLSSFFLFLVRLSIGYDDLMSSCEISSPDDCVKFFLRSSLCCSLLIF